MLYTFIAFYIFQSTKLKKRSILPFESQNAPRKEREVQGRLNTGRCHGQVLAEME